MNKNILLVLGGLVVVGVVFYSINSFNKNSGTKQTSNSLQKNEATVSDDVCGTFSQEFVSSALGKNILKTEAQSSSSTFVCQYYTDENNFVTLRLNKLNSENQKKGQTILESSEILVQSTNYLNKLPF